MFKEEQEWQRKNNSKPECKKESQRVFFFWLGSVLKRVVGWQKNWLEIIVQEVVSEFNSL